MNNSYIITATVTYEIHECKDHTEAINIYDYVVGNQSRLDGAECISVRDGFWNTLDTNGAIEPNGASGVFGEQTDL